MSAVVVDPISCEGIGMCAHLAPDVIDLDPWGFPIVARGPLKGSQRGQAKRAVRGCPRRALHLVDPPTRD